jgi:purine-nucleoside phosphorylase
MDHIYERLQEAADFLHDSHDIHAKTGLILGTGLNYLVQEIEIIREIPFTHIPYFVPSTVESHTGTLIFAKWEGVPVIILSGRNHYYEGYSMSQITFPLRLLKFLGVEQIFITNAAGGLNPKYNAGDFVIVNDHINLLPDNPLRGINDPRLGVRFPDMLKAYNPELIEKAKIILKELDLSIYTGVYAALPGPNLETPAEYRYLHTIGADLVGMSTVPEVLVAKHVGINVFVLSVVSNECYPLERIQETTIEEVIHRVNQATPMMKEILQRMILSNQLI